MIFNQPFDGAFGDLLQRELAKDYESFTVFSAFAKNSGVLRMKEAIDTFRGTGAREETDARDETGDPDGTREHRVTAFVGVDLDGTSYEALDNLLHMCDELYVVHSESAGTTFHSKIYLLEKPGSAWYAIGSNNLTGGGLWTNYESSLIKTADEVSSEELEAIRDLVDRYTDPACGYSVKIRSEDDIRQLLEYGYIDSEIRQIVRRNKTARAAAPSRTRRLFANYHVSIPRIRRDSPAGQDVSAGQEFAGVEDPAAGERIPDGLDAVAGERIPSGQEASDRLTRYGIEGDESALRHREHMGNEVFWFQTRKITGGSSNILDLSKIGRIQGGSAAGTPYEIEEEPDKMLGGIRFFDLDPAGTGSLKDITINYKGRNYFPATVKYTGGNNNWRIQLKGEPNPDDGSPKLSTILKAEGLRGKILVFEKINTSYYALSVLTGDRLPEMERDSRVWAANGNSSTGRLYGML